MNEKLNELKKQILEKNRMLDSLSRDQKPKKDKIHQVKAELDSLLYMYYKSLQCKCSNMLVFWSSGI